VENAGRVMLVGMVHLLIRCGILRKDKCKWRKDKCKWFAVCIQDQSSGSHSLVRLLRLSLSISLSLCFCFRLQGLPHNLMLSLNYHIYDTPVIATHPFSSTCPADSHVTPRSPRLLAWSIPSAFFRCPCIKRNELAQFSSFETSVVKLSLSITPVVVCGIGVLSPLFLRSLGSLTYIMIGVGIVSVIPFTMSVSLMPVSSAKCSC
jgi:hypothetical protein